MVFEIFNEFTNYIVYFIISLVIWEVLHRWYKYKNYPPGPIGLPFFGYSLFLGKHPSKTLRQLHKRYGEVFSINIGPTLYIIVSDYHVAKELVSHPLMLARPPHSFDFFTGKGGFSGMSGEPWQEQRRFALQVMRTLGLGRGLWETIIQLDADDFIKEIKNAKGFPLDIYDPLSINQADNNIALLIGRPFDKSKSNPDREIIQKVTHMAMTQFTSTNLTIAFPQVRKLLQVLPFTEYSKFKELLPKFEDIFWREVKKRVDSKEELTRDDFIGCYLEEMKKKEAEGTPHSFTLDNLIGNIGLFFISGITSATTSLLWLLLLMATYQDVQKKIHEEIDEVIGRDAKIYQDDKRRLPYTLATIMEMLRWVSINPIFPPRYAMDDFTFKEYTIPKGAHITVNSWAMLHDPNYYENPMDFRPERFIEDGQAKSLKSEGFAPFSFGRRNCPGEGIAIMTSFLYFAYLMQSFRVTTPDGRPANLEGIYGGGILPHRQELCFIER